MKFLIRQKNNGFTLIETMVAISILVLATLGPLSVASQGLRQAQFARDQVTAYYLADEAIEYIRNVRDNNAINYALPGIAWNTGFSACLGPNGCMIDATKDDVTADNDNYQDSIKPCSSITGCDRLNLDPASGTFSYSSQNPASIFTRKIVITPIQNANAATDEYKITVTMSWNTAGLKKTFTLTENILNVNKNTQ